MCKVTENKYLLENIRYNCNLLGRLFIFAFHFNKLYQLYFCSTICVKRKYILVKVETSVKLKHT